MRVAGACIGIAALSLLAQRTPDFDPTAWLIWGRQIAEGMLSTPNGPSWKPLPVLFTTPFSLAGDTVAPWLWLVVARAAGLWSLVLMFRVTERLAGRTAALLAVAGLALATDYLYNAARGDSEGILVALALLAIDQHLRGRPVAAFLSAAGAGLVRPEVWPLLGLYGLWLMRERPRGRVAGLVVAAGVVVVAAWLVPEKIGSGDWFRAATRAQHPVEGSPGQSAFPFGMTFVNGAIALSLPIYAGAVKAVLDAWRARSAPVLGIAAISTALMIAVAIGAEFGFTGNLRYVTLPAALLCVLGGIGLPPLWRALRRDVRVAAAVLGGLSVAFSAGLLVRNGFQLAEEGRVYGRELPEVIDRAGGERAVLSCPMVGASHFERQMVAYRLHLRPSDVRLGILVRDGIVFAREGTGAAAQGTLPVWLRHGDWVVRSSCRPVRGDRGARAASGRRARTSR